MRLRQSWWRRLGAVGFAILLTGWPAFAAPTDVEVVFAGGAPDVQLAGALAFPVQAGRRPAVVLVSGSGPQDRDGTVLGHKPFELWADTLTNAGFIVLRYDDRGVGQSTGDFRAGTTADFQSDAEAAVRFLRMRPEVDPDRIAVVGHSEGGAIAAMMSSAPEAPAAIVSLAGMLAPGFDQILLQEIVTGRDQGADDDYERALREAYANVRVATALSKPERLARMEAISAAWTARFPQDGPNGRAAADSLLKRPRLLASDWFVGLLGLHAATALHDARSAVLLVNGTTDQQVLPGPNLDAGRAALGEIDGECRRIALLPDLNHLLQTSSTGSTTEYEALEETVAVSALNEVTAWLTRRLIADSPRCRRP